MSILKLKDSQGNWVGIPTVKGATGNGISSAVLNNDYTLTLTFTDGTTYTTPSIRGEKGEQGDPATSMEIHICSSSEYDSQTRIPTIQNPNNTTFYLVPTVDGTSPDLFTEWVYVNNAWEMFGSASVDLSGYLTDVTVDGTSVVTDGVAEIPVASRLNFGVVKIDSDSSKSGLYIDSNTGFVEIVPAVDSIIKTGTNNHMAIAPNKQDKSVFYGLAKAAGHDEKDSTLPVGQYTDEAKSAIQNMLGIDFHYLTPEMYGAVGDGTTDDSVALQNCINDAITQELPVRGFNIYATTQPINIVAKYLNVYIHEIIYSGNDVGVILTGRYNNINIDEIDAYDSTGCGFRLTTTSEREAIYNEIHIGYIAAYGNGIEYLNPYGESQGLYYNRLYINQLYSRNANCIYINATNRQCGENSFWGKHVTNNNGYFVYCENSGNNPSNKFYEFCIESSSKNGVYGQATLINCRTVECMDRRKPDNNEGNIFTFNGVLPMGKAINTPLDYLCVDVSNASTYADRLAIIKTQLEGGETKAYAFDAAFPQEMSYVIGEGFRLWDYYSVTDSALGNNSPTGKVIVYYNHKGFVPDYDWYHKIEVNEYYTLTTDHVVPTIFDIDTNTTIHLDDSYCPVGINKFKVIQYDDKKAVIYDHNNNLVFNGQNYGAGTYEIECHMTSHTFEIIANSETFVYGDTATRGKYFGVNEVWDVEAVIDSMPDVPVEDVRINGTSIVSDGVGNIPYAAYNKVGVVQVNASRGTAMSGSTISTFPVDSATVKAGTQGYQPITPAYQHESVFYGLAKASGDTTQSQSNNAVGTYTDSAKSSIKTMLGVDTDLATKLDKPEGTVTTSILLNDFTVTTAQEEGWNSPHAKATVKSRIPKNARYIVTYNGIDYYLPCQLWGDNNHKVVEFLGNISLYANDTNGFNQTIYNVPFCIISDLDNASSIDVLTTTAETATFKITKIFNQTETIDEEYIYGSADSPFKYYDGGTSTYSKLSIGNANLVTSRGGIAIGSNNKSTGEFAIATGYGTLASGNDSLSEGNRTLADGYASHAEGVQTEASGNASHTEGLQTVASGIDAHAEGWLTTASGMDSHAEGGGTIANHYAQHVFGTFNIADTSTEESDDYGNYIEIVGNGGNDENRSNARTLDWSGNERLAGSLTLGANTANEVSLSPTELSGLKAIDLTNYITNTDYATYSTAGVVKVDSDWGIGMYDPAWSSGDYGNFLYISPASSAQIKAGSTSYKAIVPSTQHESIFYGLAKASGDTTQTSSSNAVGTYTEEAKTAIKQMLGIHDTIDSFVEDVTGTDVTITGQPSYRYNCGEVYSLTVTPPSSGTIDFRFTSGSTPTVLTLPSTVKMPEWWVEVEANTIYEMCITDGVYCGVMSWAM